MKLTLYVTVHADVSVVNKNSLIKHVPKSAMDFGQVF